MRNDPISITNEEVPFSPQEAGYEEEKLVAVWSAQFVGDNWSMLPLRNVASIIWSDIS